MCASRRVAHVPASDRPPAELIGRSTTVVMLPEDDQVSCPMLDTVATPRAEGLPVSRSPRKNRLTFRSWGRGEGRWRAGGAGARAPAGARGAAYGLRLTVARRSSARVVGLDGVAGVHEDGVDGAGLGRDDGGLLLHGGEDEEGPALLNPKTPPKTDFKRFFATTKLKK